MKPALSFQNKRVPQHWDEFPIGEYMLAEINNRLEPWWEQVFGYHLIKLGNLSTYIDTSGCSIKHQVNISEDTERAGIIADIDELPFVEHAVDAALLAHSLEFYPDPHHLLREAHRVLMPGGYLFITGFNPFSFCGLSRFFHFNSDKPPWSGRFFTTARVKDWLNLLGFEVLMEERFIFSSLSNRSDSVPFKAWRQYCEAHFPSFGSVYCIVAKKRVLPLTPMRPKWRSRPGFRPAVKGATFTGNRKSGHPS